MSSPATKPVRRVAALAGGLVVLGFGARYTFGLVLMAPLGVLVVHRVQRWRGRRLSFWSSWVGSAAGVWAGFAALAFIFVVNLPKDTWTKVAQASDSAMTAHDNDPPPSWIQHLVPGAAASEHVARRPSSTRSNLILLSWGALFAVSLGSALLGTVGWIGVLLCLYYALGHGLEATAVEGVGIGDV